MDDTLINLIREFRENNGRIGGIFENSSLLLLHHIGARSGRKLISPLAYRAYEDGYAVFAITDPQMRPPGWFRNLKAHPDTVIEVGLDTIEVHASEIVGVDRYTLHADHAARFPAAQGYQETPSREVPVVGLFPRSPGSTPTAS